MRTDRLKSLGRLIRLATLYRAAGLNPGTIRAATTFQPRDLTPREAEAIRAVLRELVADIKHVIKT